MDPIYYENIAFTCLFAPFYVWTCNSICCKPATLIWLRPSSFCGHCFFAKVLLGCIPDVSHLRVFGCCVWIFILESQRHTISAHHQEGIYVGFDSLSIICYIDPSTSTLLRARFVDCWFEEDIFSSLKGGASILKTSTGLTFQAP